MLSVCASGRLVGSANVPDYRIAVDQLAVMHSSNALMMFEGYECYCWQLSSSSLTWLKVLR